jgi:ATP-binding cassette, subfamily B (MDR/TAP), member 1
MIEVLYTPVETCAAQANEPSVCNMYYHEIAQFMKQRAMDIFYGYLGTMVVTTIGFTLLFWGFGSASERMNKRVRDSAFASLLRQEVAWFDMRSPSFITAQLAEDAALLHSFSGEPIRTLIVNLSSTFVGVIISFIYMWYVHGMVH